MRLQLIVLLALAAVFTCAVSEPTTANSIKVNQDDGQRFLRSDTTAHVDDDEEERAAWFDGLTKLIKPNTKVLTKLERENPALAKLAKKKDLTQAFKSLNVGKFQNVDDLFASSKYEQWIGYMLHWNKQSKNEPFTVAKMFSEQLGSKKAFEMFAVAAKSTNPKVEQMGKAYQVQLFKQFQKAKNTPQQISTSLGGDAAAAKMFATVIRSSSSSDRKLGKQFATTMLTQWKTEGKTLGQVVQIAPDFRNAYNKMLLASTKSTTTAKAARAAAAARV